MKKMFARMLALAMTCVVLLTGCGQNPSSSVSGSGGNGSGVQSSGDWPKQPVNVICPASAGGGTDLILRTINEYFTRMTGQPFVGGYPVGARTAIALYENGQCSKTEAERLLAFCNNSGPAFILGVVGTGIFASSRAGLLLYLAHIAASLCVGLLFRFYRPGEGPRPGRHAAPQFQAASFPVAFTHSITGALSSTLNICAFVLFFTVVIRMLFLSGVMGALAGGAAALLSPLGLDQAWAQRLITGLLELSSGVSSLTGAGTVTGRLSMAAFMLGWAGLSVHCQVLAFLGDSGLSLRTYLTGKLLHGGLSALFTALLVRRFPLEAPVSSYLAEQVEGIASLDFQRALTISTAAAWGVWLLFVALAVYMVKKSSGKPRPKRV